MIPRLVLAVGNPHRGDDGVGPALLEVLRGYADLTDVEMLDGGTGGFELALVLEGREHVIVLDAADFAGAPGSWRRFTLEELLPESGESLATLHDAGVAQAIALSLALGHRPHRFSLYGIQPACLEPILGLSPEVTSAVSEVASVVLSELRDP